MRISVVIATFARPALLATTLDSVLAQTHTDLEVLVCDNGGDQRVGRMVARLRDPRFRYLPREENVGIQRNVLYGFSSATGDLLFKLDDDDLLLPDTLARLHDSLEEFPEACLAFGDLLEFEGSDTSDAGRIRRSDLAGLYRGFADLAAGGNIHLGACLIRRSALEHIHVDPATETAFDLDILLQLGDGGTAVHVPDAPVLYRRHDDADSSRAPVRQSIGALIALDHAVVRRGEPGLSLAFRQAYEHAALNAARGLLRAGRGREARRILDALPDEVSSPRIRRLRWASRVPMIARPIAMSAHRRYRRANARRATPATTTDADRLVDRPTPDLTNGPSSWVPRPSS